MQSDFINKAHKFFLPQMAKEHTFTSMLLPSFLFNHSFLWLSRVFMNEKVNS